MRKLTYVYRHRYRNHRTRNF